MKWNVPKNHVPKKKVTNEAPGIIFDIYLIFLDVFGYQIMSELYHTHAHLWCTQSLFSSWYTSCAKAKARQKEHQMTGNVGAVSVVGSESWTSMTFPGPAIVTICHRFWLQVAFPTHYPPLWQETWDELFQSADKDTVASGSCPGHKKKTSQSRNQSTVDFGRFSTGVL